VDEVIAKLKSKEPVETLRRHRHLLAATTLPDPATAAAFEAARKGLLLHPGAALRFKIADPFPLGYRDTATQKITRALAEQGYRIDPEAGPCVRLVGAGQESTEQRSKMIGPNLVRREQVPFYFLRAYLEISGPEGKVMLYTDAVESKVETGKSEWARGQAWEEATTAIRNQRLPRLVLRDSTGAPVKVPTLSGMGIDGVLEAALK
jgi:hypothetical protein